jgi:RimJ/RimL family protein N-acetyltransferase
MAPQLAGPRIGTIMEPLRNALGQPIGHPVPGWRPRPPPPRTPMAGRTCDVVPLEPDRHAAELFAAYADDKDGRNWTYLTAGPFASLAEYQKWMDETCSGDDPLFHAVIDKRDGRAVGVASYLRIDAGMGVIEVGHINFSTRLQRTVASTEAMFLMMRRAFDELGYRRYEWKCDSLNEPSRRAALRLGFVFEGIFRQATMYRGRNRDTAWYSIIDKEWPALQRAYEAWLAPANFDAAGRQRMKLAALIEKRRA